MASSEGLDANQVHDKAVIVVNEAMAAHRNDEHQPLEERLRKVEQDFTAYKAQKDAKDLAEGRGRWLERGAWSSILASLEIIKHFFPHIFGGD